MAKNNGIIRRRIGGVSQQTGKGIDISKLKRKPKKYEGISSTYEAARKDKPKRKVTTALGAGARGAGIEAGTEALQEKKKTTTKKKTVDAAKVNPTMYEAKGRTKTKPKYKSLQKEADIIKKRRKARGKTARDKLYTGRRKTASPDPHTRVEVRKLKDPTIKERMKTEETDRGKGPLRGPATHTFGGTYTDPRQKKYTSSGVKRKGPYSRGTTAGLFTHDKPKLTRTSGETGKGPLQKGQVDIKKLRRYLKRVASKKDIEARGGRTSPASGIGTQGIYRDRKKGGTVSRWKGGNLEVSQFYD